MNEEMGLVESNKELSIGGALVTAREQHEIQAAVISAKRFPRDEFAATTKAIKSFQRPTMAEDALYSFPRGGQKVRGPSVYSARELARCWGNLRYGLRVVGITERVHIKGFAFDLESNNYIEAEDEFAKRIQRKGRDGVAKWVEPDERDLRELISRRGAILVRNCILQLLPPDLVEDCMATADQTMEDVARNELKQSPEEALKRLVFVFDRIGVSTEVLEKKLGHPLKAVDAKEIAELRQIYSSIKDGHTTREEQFDLAKPGHESDELNSKLDAKLKKGNGKDKDFSAADALEGDE